jgi:hypothetical protein
VRVDAMQVLTSAEGRPKAPQRTPVGARAVPKAREVPSLKGCMSRCRSLKTFITIGSYV